MDENIFKLLYKEAFLSHKDLTIDDINYGVNYCFQVYQFDLDPLIHLNKNYYIGLFSNNYNDKMDQLIKSRSKNIKIIDFWPELNNVDLNDKKILQIMLNISKSALYNALHFYKLNTLFSFNNILSNCLLNLCEENKFDMNNFNTFILVGLIGDSGSIIKIIKRKYIKLSDIKDEEDIKLKEKYRKEIKMLNY